jgi:endonuclease/exonuclease/phosphatase family metal-dependent hydrolase
MPKATVRLRLMSYNLGGGRKDKGSSEKDALEVIRRLAPDVLAAQEVVDREDVSGRGHRMSAEIRRALGRATHSFVGPTLSMEQHFHIRKTLFVDGLFDDWANWTQGNALFSRWRFVGLGDASGRGRPWNIPLYRPAEYDGTRDTDPRSVVLARIDLGGGSHPFVMSTHFTTLRGERGGGERRIKGKMEEARALRRLQGEALVTLTQAHILDRGELAFLMGDFNAAVDEACIAQVLSRNQAPFVRLVPENDSTPTHRMKVSRPVDHIFVHPGNRRVEYKCWIPHDETVDRASDHRPVVADVTVYESTSSRFKTRGPGVFKAPGE